MLAPLLLALLAAPAPATRFVVTLAGNPAGAETVSVAPDGERAVHFEFNDRGRGPKLDSRIRLNPDGTLASLATTGDDYYKGSVDERFALASGRASWKNKAERGERALAAPAFYSSFDSVPEELGLLAAALLEAKGGRLPLLPEGEARIEKIGEHDCAVAAKAERVTQYAIAGLAFSPVPVWIDAHGALFASASSWLTVVREGAEACVPDLIVAQDAASAVRLRSLAASASRVPNGPFAIRHARLFDAETMAIHDGTTVVVAGDRIAAVGPDASVTPPAGAEIVDATGKTLLPGLWDMHVHVTEDDGTLDIAAGITTVRDLANDVDALARLRKAWDEGSAVGPRVIPAGFIDGPGPYAGPSKVLAATVDEGLAAVRRYHELGYPQIKLYSSLKPELVAPLAAEAHRLGMRVSGHVPAFMTAEQAVRDGYDEIQHVNMLFLNFWADTVKDTRTPLRFTAVAEKAAELDLASDPVRSFVGLLKQRGTVVDPTLTVFESMFTDRPGTLSASYAAVADRLPPAVRRGFLGGGLPLPEGMDQRYRDSFRALERMVKLLEDAGVPIVAGTDDLAGFTLQRELELYVEAGIRAPRVLQIATLGAARVMKRDLELGSIAAGKKADLVLVDGDPATRISDVRRPVLVMKDGRVYDPAALDRALGVAP